MDRSIAYGALFDPGDGFLVGGAASVACAVIVVIDIKAGCFAVFIEALKPGGAGTEVFGDFRGVAQRIEGSDDAASIGACPDSDVERDPYRRAP